MSRKKLPRELIKNSRPVIHGDSLEAAENLRNIALQQGSVERIQYLDQHEALAMQGILGHGTAFGTWITPREWSGRNKTKLDLRQRIFRFMSPQLQVLYQSESELRGMLQEYSVMDDVLVSPTAMTYEQRVLEEAVLALTRYLLLCRMGPAGMGKRGNKSPLDPSHVAELAHSDLPPLMALAIAKRLESREACLSLGGCRGKGNQLRFISLLHDADLDGLTTHARNAARIEFNRMQILADQGLWSDISTLSSSLLDTTPVKGAASTAKKESRPNAYQPLPDDYVAEMGRRSIWLIRDLGPNLIQVASKISEFFEIKNCNGKEQKKSKPFAEIA